ncbi:MAG: dihydrofolate reductase [Bacteroidota bacterium]
MKTIIFSFFIIASAFLFSCGNNGEKKNEQSKQDSSAVVSDTFTYQTDKFADLRILRFQIPGFENLSLSQKEFLYYLSEATLAGKDIIWDQNYKYNLTIRKTLETIVSSYKGDKNSDDWKKFMVYAKRVWFSNGIHHHYASKKIIPEINKEYFANLVKNSDASYLPVNKNEKVDAFIKRITPIIFDPKIAPKKINLDPKFDLVTSSATNFYEDITEKEVTLFYKSMVDTSDKEAISYGLNSKIMKENGKTIEKKWMIGGMYSQAIEKIIYWLEKANTVAENAAQKKSIDLLIQFYKTGDLKTFDDYCVAWVQDTSSLVDVINGFIEVYDDPLGRKGSWEAVVSFKDMEASKRIKAISNQAQWFEDNAPIMEEHKKKNIKGIIANVMTIVQEAGGAAPTTPIGINLPNSNWIRQQYGSKSVTLGNIVYAYEKAKSSGLTKEFFLNDTIIDGIKKFAAIAGAITTDMHEAIGHASGKLNPGVSDMSETLKNYANTLEESRADLVALYYVLDKKLIDIGVISSPEVGKTEYNTYITNGLLIQMARLKPGDNIEESHMRNRQMIASWAYQKGEKDNVIEKKIKDGKTYFVINDYDKLRKLFGELLKEVQRIKSEGDYQSGKNLVENYGVKVDAELHKEVLARYSKLGLAPYAGFIQPKLVPVMEGNKIINVKVEYPFDFVQQMLEYGKKYSLLPVIN